MSGWSVWQISLVDWDVNGPVRVTGGAGTGKTVVAIHRARHLADHLPTGSGKASLFTTFTRNLAQAIEQAHGNAVRGGEETAGPFAEISCGYTRPGTGGSGVDTELWGTFSVADHRRRRAWVTDVLLYDRLAIPVPDGEDEWARWSSMGRNPERQRQLVELLGMHAVPIPWTLERHEQWATGYADIADPDAAALTAGGAKARVAGAIEFDLENVRAARVQREDPDSIAQYVTRAVLANSDDFELNLRQLAALPNTDVEAVPAYGSLAHFEREQPYHLELGKEEGVAARPILMFEFPVLVPSGSTLSDEALLERAVRLADRDETREYRDAYHAWRRDVVLSGVTEDAALRQIESLANDYRSATRGMGFKTRARYGIGVFAAAAGVAALVFPPAGAIAAVAALGSAVIDTEDVELDSRLQAGAFFHQARHYLSK